MMKNRRLVQTAGGFALLQLMIAMAILSGICVLTFAAVQQISKGKKQQEASADRYQTGRNALSRMVSDISMAYLSAGQLPGKESAPRTFFDGIRKGPTDEIRFTYFGHLRFYEDSPESDTAAVSYFVKPDADDSRKLNLIRRESRRIQYIDPAALDSIPGQSEVLCEDVTKLELWYYDPVSKKWVDTWRTTQVDGFPTRLPSRVVVKLGIASAQGELFFFSETQPVMFQPVDNSPK